MTRWTFPINIVSVFFSNVSFLIYCAQVAISNSDFFSTNKIEGTPILKLQMVRRLKMENFFRKIKIRRYLSQKFVPKICPKKFFPKILKMQLQYWSAISTQVFLRSIDSKIYRRSEFLLNGLFGRLTYLSPVLLLISNLTNELRLHQFLASKTN